VSVSRALEQLTHIRLISFSGPAIAIKCGLPLKSTPITLPVGPTFRAAMSVSVAKPQPRSRTIAPTGRSANCETLDTPAKASHATLGRLASKSAG
jgi:hypothetical protein